MLKLKKIAILISIILLSLIFTSCKNEQVDKIEDYIIIEENIIIGEGTEYELDGILTLPEGIDKNLSAVVLVHGSGPSDMNETAYAYKPFKDIAEYLTSQGIAVLRYDKRTYSHNVKITAEIKNLTVKEETIEDAILAADLLKNDSRINNEKVFIIGHSLGGILAPRIDAEGGNFAGLIILAGSPRLFSEIWYDQAMNEIETLPDNQRNLGTAQVKEYMKFFNNFNNMTDEEAKNFSFMGATGYYFKDMDSHPVNDYLNNILKPMLIMQGEKDFQVFADKDFILYQELLQGRDNITFKLYPELNHFFITSTTGTINEYSTEDNVDLNVLKDIASWIKTILK